MAEGEDRSESRSTGSFAPSLGHAVKVLRVEQGWSRKELAERSGISVSYVSEIENGRKPPSSSVLVRVAEALGLRPSDLLAHAEQRMPATTSRWSADPSRAERRDSPRPSRGTWFHEPTTSSAPAGDDTQAPTLPDAVGSDLVLAQQVMCELLARMIPDDRARLLDMARRLAGAA